MPIKKRFYLLALLCGGLGGGLAMAQAPVVLATFEGTGFPPTGWTNTGSAPTLWSRYAGASGYGVGVGSARAYFYNFSSGTGILETASFEAAVEGDTLGFDYAYAAYAGEVDRLVVYASADGGTNYALLLDMPGGTTGALNTAGTKSSAFVPTALEWKTKGIPLPPAANRVRFDAVTAFGNNLYLDNVQIYDGSHAADLVLTLTDAPDPVAAGSNLTYSILISNAGPTTAESVFLTNQCPPGAVWVSTTAERGSWTTNGDVLTGELGSFAMGETATVTVVVQPQTMGTATNWAETSAATLDPQPVNNRRSATTLVSQTGGDLFFRTNYYSVSEDRGSISLSVSRTGGVVGTVSFTYETVDGTATAGSDYTARSGTLTMTNNVTGIAWSIPILNDSAAEDEESFSVRLTNPTGGAVLVGPSNTTIQIHDEDGRAMIPFEEGFESGAFSNYWAFYSTATTGPQISSNDLPHGGSRHVNMNGVPLATSLNELTLNADLSGQEGAHLRFWHKRF